MKRVWLLLLIPTMGYSIGVYKPMPKIALTVGVGGITSLGGGTIPFLGLDIETFSGSSVYFYFRNKVLLSMKLDMPTSGFQDSSFTYLPQVGFGFYMFDKRKDHIGMGWTGNMNIAAGIVISSVHVNNYTDPLKDNTDTSGFLRNNFGYSFEANMGFRYHYKFENSISFGFNFGTFYTRAAKQALYYGFSLGGTF